MLVNRGWLPADPDRSHLPDVSVTAEPRRSAGSSTACRAPRSPPRPGADEGRCWPRRMLYPTAADIGAALGYPVADYQLLLARDAPDGYLREWRPALMTPQAAHRLRGAVVRLGAALVVLYVVLNVRKAGAAPHESMTPAAAVETGERAVSRSLFLAVVFLGPMVVARGHLLQRFPLAAGRTRHSTACSTSRARPLPDVTMAVIGDGGTPRCAASGLFYTSGRATARRSAAKRSTQGARCASRSAATGPRAATLRRHRRDRRRGISRERASRHRPRRGRPGRPTILPARSASAGAGDLFLTDPLGNLVHALPGGHDHAGHVRRPAAPALGFHDWLMAG